MRPPTYPSFRRPQLAPYARPDIQRFVFSNGVKGTGSRRTARCAREMIDPLLTLRGLG
jgi:hypothetical protein